MKPVLVATNKEGSQLANPILSSSVSLQWLSSNSFETKMMTNNQPEIHRCAVSGSWQVKQHNSYGGWLW